MQQKPFRDYNSYLRQLFGCRVQKISIDAGLTCPNRDGTKGREGCVYCNDKGSGTGAFLRGQSIRDQIRDGKARLCARYKAQKFLAYFQSFSNTYAPLALLASLYGEALEDPDVVGLTVGTRPDCISDEVLDHLETLSCRGHLIWLELGLQSVHDRTLHHINRGHDFAAFEDAVQRIRRRHVPVCAHIILGLPGETAEDMLQTARVLAQMDIQAVKIHLLYVIRGTKLAQWHREGRYTCLSRERYATLVGQFISLLPPDMIIQRITGDPHPEELIAPLWALEKQTNFQAVLQTMLEQNLYQGKFFTPAPPGRATGSRPGEACRQPLESVR